MAHATVKAVYALYSDPDTVQRAVERLRAAGVGDDDITVISSEPFEEHEFSHRYKATWLYWIAGLGGLIGLLAGGGLTYVTSVSWPLVTGGMPIVAPWPYLVIMFETTMLGAILATVITLLITAKIPGQAAPIYDPEISDGKILVGVADPPEASIGELERALRASGRGQVKTVG